LRKLDKWTKVDKSRGDRPKELSTTDGKALKVIQKRPDTGPEIQFGKAPSEMVLMEGWLPRTNS